MLSVPTSPSTVEVRSAGKASPKRRSAVGWIAALTSALLVAGPLASAPPAYAASVPSMVALGTAETFSALAGSYVTLATTSTVNGDVGAGAAITAGPGSVGGSQHPNNDAVDQKAQADLTTAYNDAEGRAPIAPDIAGELGGQTLTTGVYHSTAAFTLTGTLKLDGGGNPNAVFIFQTPAAMTLAASAKVALIGGAQASHVYWQIASYVTLGAQAQFAGTILSDSYISFGAGASLAGRALSRTGYVTLDAGSITSQRVAPVAPASVSATAGNASATVSWPAPVSNGGSTVTGYTITPSPACAGCSGLTTTGLSTTVTGLTNGTTYTFTVTATNAEGTSAPSAASNPVTPSGPATAPSAPTAVSATAGNAQALVTWTAPSSSGGSPITGYTITPSPACSSCSGLTTTGLSTTVTGLTNGTSYTFTVTATNAVGTSSSSAPSNSVTPSTGMATGTGAGFTGVNPTRVLDTRYGTGAPQAKLGTGQVLTLTIPNLPSGTTAVALNVTVTNPTADSYLTVYPAGGTRPVASNLNFERGQTIPNMVLVPVGPGNTVTFYNLAGDVDVIADLLGYYAPGTGAGFTGVNPIRVLDTRHGTGAPQAKLGAGKTLTLTIPHLPSGTTAVALNVTVTNPTAPSYLTVYPAGGTRPVASNLNYGRGLTIPNMALVPVGPGNTVTFYNHAGTVDVVADLLGYYAPGTGAGFTGVNPTRVLDTRHGNGAPQAKLGAGKMLTLTIPNLPSGTTAVALNVTVTNPTAASYLTVYPAGGPRPVASNLNYGKGQTIPNMVMVPVGPGNTVTFYNYAGDVDVIADLLGSYL
jgi:hypothetical protein